MDAILETLVADLVVRRAVTVREDASLATAARHMAAGRVGAAVVVRGARNVGLLSERDIVERIGAGVDPATYTAGEAMTAPLVVAYATDTVHEALDRMARLGIRHLPVLDADVHLLGMISVLELVQRLMDASPTIDLREPPQEVSRGFG
jgi:CBS domain-containing protein